MNPQIEHELFSSKDITEFLQLFFSLGLEEQLSIFPNETVIEKGTYLYRARKANASLNESNCNDPSQWGPPPINYVSKGRFNTEKDRVLYVASDSLFLPNEIGLNKGDEYFLAKYICNNTFSVSNLLTANNRINMLLHKVALAPEKISGLNE